MFRHFATISDLDECTRVINICLNGGTCTNTYGAYECLCLQGFNGTTCEYGKFLLHVLYER